jgi:hypothetical protein
VEQRKLNLKPKFEGGSTCYSFKRFIPGALNRGLIGSTSTALPKGWYFQYVVLRTL